MERSFVLHGDLCYSETIGTLKTLPGGYLVCENGVSAGVFAELPERYRNLPLHDRAGALILPGLVDLHAHAPQYAFRALGMDLELLDWLQQRAFPEEAKYADTAYAKDAYSRYVADVRRGPNTRAVMFATRHVPATVLLMDLLEESGLVTMVGKVNMDRNSPSSLQEADAETSLRDTRDWLSQAKGRYKNTAPILTPRFVPSCTDTLLTGLGEIQREHGLPVQSHLSENLGECELVQSLYPDAPSYGDVYARFGLFGGDTPTVMAHCVYPSEREMALMKERGVMIAHCPQSNTNIASGIAPVRRYLENGMPVGLGSDVAGGVHTSIFRAMTDAVQVSKLRWRLVEQAEAPLTLAEAFYLATKGGGAFFGKVGSFEPGYELDALVLDDAALAAPYPLSVEDRLARVAYLSDDRTLRQKYVRGKLAYQNQ